MKSKTEQLNELFKEWQRRVPENIVKDGIVDEQLYKNALTKVLYITKEPNNPKQEAGDFREWWKEEIKDAFSYRIAEWSYGILNDFPEYDEIWKNKDAPLQAIHQIAFMNIKKVGGKGVSKFQAIMDHAKKYYDLIHREIEIIAPNIIILGVSFWEEIRNNLFPKVEWENSGYDIDIAKFKQTKVIDFYHPSSRTAPAAAYSLLQNIVNSEKFRKL